MPWRFFNPNPLGEDLTVLLLDQLALATESGAPLHEAVAMVAEESGSRLVQRRLQKVSDQLRMGTASEEQTSILSDILPERLRPLLLFGAKQGHLPVVLKTLAEQEAGRQGLRQRMRELITYPVLVLSLLAALVVFVFEVVVPPFVVIFDDFQLQLPAMTQAVISASAETPRIALFCVVALFVVALGACLEPTRGWFHWLRTAMPILGRAWIWSGHEQFARQMAMLTSLDLPIDEALDHTANGLPDRHVAAAASRLAEQCRRGTPLGEAMAASRAFERPLTAAITAAEAEHDLAQAWKDASHDYRSQLDFYTKFLGRIVPPILVVTVALIISFLVVSLMIPLVALIENLS